jgi:hypothetical protein
MKRGVKNVDTTWIVVEKSLEKMIKLETDGSSAKIYIYIDSPYSGTGRYLSTRILQVSLTDLE